ncbi:alpha-mannosidase, partial [Paenibacillus anaericanus]
MTSKRTAHIISHTHWDREWYLPYEKHHVRLENKERLGKYITEGHLLIGPWYILQDAFLTSGEANVRNMQIGHQDSKRYGEPSKIGYFPDTFGLVGQTP